MGNAPLEQDRTGVGWLVVCSEAIDFNPMATVLYPLSSVTIYYM